MHNILNSVKNCKISVLSILLMITLLACTRKNVTSFKIDASVYYMNINEKMRLLDYPSLITLTLKYQHKLLLTNGQYFSEKIISNKEKTAYSSIFKDQIEIVTDSLPNKIPFQWIINDIKCKYFLYDSMWIFSGAESKGFFMMDISKIQIDDVFLIKDSTAEHMGRILNCTFMTIDSIKFEGTYFSENESFLEKKYFIYNKTIPFGSSVEFKFKSDILENFSNIQKARLSMKEVFFSKNTKNVSLSECSK